MRPFSQLLGATAVVMLASGVACKNDSGVTGPTALEGQYKGTLAGESSPSLSASLALTVAASTKGTITPSGAAPITVTGTYVASPNAGAGSGGGLTIPGPIDHPDQRYELLIGYPRWRRPEGSPRSRRSHHASPTNRVYVPALLSPRVHQLAR